MDLKFDNVTERDRNSFTATDALGTDVRDMERLGKKQEFQRNFGLWSALGFVSIYLATWEYVGILCPGSYSSWSSLGSGSSQSQRWISKWWLCWPFLVLHCNRLLLCYYRRQFGRNGIYGTYFGR
jgi:hypothetical protein